MTEESVKSDHLAERLDRRDYNSLRRSLREWEIADISEAFTKVDLASCIALFRMVPKGRRANVFSYLPFERQEELLEELPEVVVTSIVNEMEPVDRTHLLVDLPFAIRNKIMLKLSPAERQMAWQLLSYPEDSVGRIMTPEFLRLNTTMQVNEAIEMLRWSDRYPPEQLHYLFVVDQGGKFIGEISLAHLVLADPGAQPVSEVMNTNPVSIQADEDQESAVDFFRKYDRPYCPVVDSDEKLVGIVTADDVFDVAEEEATEDIHQFGGQATLEDSYFSTGLFELFRKRAGWLATLFIGGILTAAMLRHYEALTAAMAWLVFFVPLIISSGGNTGSQTAALVIRGIAVKEMATGDWLKVLWRELVVCLGLGIVLSAMGFVLVKIWHMDNHIGLIVSISLLGVVLFGGIAGAMLPFAFKRLKLDPAVSSSPLLASMVDIVGVLIFYNTAVYVVNVWAS